MPISKAKLTRKYQITIPAEVRRSLGLEAGDVVYLSVEGERVFLRRMPESWSRYSRGLGAEMWSEEGGGAGAIERERGSWVRP